MFLQPLSTLLILLHKDAERKIVVGGQRHYKNDASIQLISLRFIEKKKQEIAQIELEEHQKKELEKQEKEKHYIIAEKQNEKKKIKNIITSEPNIKKEGGRIVIKTADINFDYKLWYIRKDVKKVLQPVINLLLKYPNMQIEIGLHTDIRGNEAYNRDLSQKRATSTKEYLVLKGIESHRIIAVGYGDLNLYKTVLLKMLAAKKSMKLTECLNLLLSSFNNYLYCF